VTSVSTERRPASEAACALRWERLGRPRPEHGRSEDMGSPLLAALARHASDMGLWSLRFNFAFADAARSPPAATWTRSRISASDGLRADDGGTRYRLRRGTRPRRMGLGGRGRRTSSVPERSSWASATRDNRNGGWRSSASRNSRSRPWSWSASSRTGRTCLAARPARADDEREPRDHRGADHRLKAAAGRIMSEAVLMKVEAWLHLRKAERGA